MSEIIKYKVYLFKKEIKKKGLIFTLKRFLFYLLRPLIKIGERNKFLVNLYYGTLPNLKQKIFPQKSPYLLKLPKTKLVEEVRKFWYSNIPGYFDLEGEKISRKDIFTFGGPNPKFTCPICQKSEWLSRVRQKNLFQPHKCSQAKECEDLCQKQGNDLWTHYHQNFDFAVGCDEKLPAPKIILIVPKKTFERFFTPRCDLGYLIGKRRWAFSAQIDVTFFPYGIDWSRYDLLFTFNEGNNWKFPRPNLPIILYGHDFWERKVGYQWAIDWLKPDIFLTSYPTCWKENFKFSQKTKIAFLPLFPTQFFTRTNLENKKYDLLMVGATANPIYKPRVELSKQISKLKNKYKIEFSQWVGALGAEWQGPTYYIDSLTKEPVYYLNKWSEYLSSAKYVIFGRIANPKKQFLVFKYYETLGSGAVPIFPEVPDLKYLGLKPFEHYIPLSEVEGDNKKLKYYLENYEEFKYIAKNAVKWYQEKSDKMIFEDFENLIREITNYKYPKRII